MVVIIHIHHYVFCSFFIFKSEEQDIFKDLKHPTDSWVVVVLPFLVFYCLTMLFECASKFLLCKGIDEKRKTHIH